MPNIVRMVTNIVVWCCHWYIVRCIVRCHWNIVIRVLSLVTDTVVRCCFNIDLPRFAKMRLERIEKMGVEMIEILPQVKFWIFWWCWKWSNVFVNVSLIRPTWTVMSFAWFKTRKRLQRFLQTGKNFFFLQSNHIWSGEPRWQKEYEAKTLCGRKLNDIYNRQ